MKYIQRRPARIVGDIITDLIEYLSHRPSEELEDLARFIGRESVLVGGDKAVKTRASSPKAAPNVRSSDFSSQPRG